MDNKFKDEIILMGACKPIIEWVGERTLLESFNECDNGYIMFCYLEKKIDCFRWPTNKDLWNMCILFMWRTIKYTRNSQRRTFVKAIQTMEEYIKGNKTKKEVQKIINKIYKIINKLAWLNIKMQNKKLIEKEIAYCITSSTPSDVLLHSASAIAEASNRYKRVNNNFDIHVRDFIWSNAYKHEMKIQADYIRTFMYKNYNDLVNSF